MIAATIPMKREARPPYSRRTISSRPRWPSAPRKNLPPALNHCGPIALPLGSTTSLTSPPSRSFSRVWVVFGPVWATWSAQTGASRQQIRITKKTARAKSANLLRRRRRHAIAQGPPVWRPSPPSASTTREPSESSPDPASEAAAPPGTTASLPDLCDSDDTKCDQEKGPAYSLNSRLVSSVSKVGFQIAVSRLMFSETNRESVRVPYGAQAASSMNDLSSSAYSFSWVGPSCSVASLSIFSFSSSLFVCEKFWLLVGWMLSPFSRIPKKSF